MDCLRKMQMAERLPIIDWVEEEAKSTLKEHERKHFWNQFENIERDINNGFRAIKGIAQNPMVLSPEDLNNLIELSAEFVARTHQINAFFVKMVRSYVML